MNSRKKKTAVSTVETNELKTLEQPSSGVSPLVQMFASGQIPIEQIDQMMTLNERWEKNESRKAYHEALARAKAEMPVATKSGKNTHLNSTYATLDDYLAVANPVLAKYGLSVSWDMRDQTAESVTATCRISHQMGHSEASAPVTMPITKGNNAVSAAQSVGIAMTYARRYSFTAILGMATEDGDGGNQTRQTAKVKELPPYDDARFKSIYPEWQAQVEKGDKTPTEIITSLQNRSTLNATQLKSLKGLEDCVPVKS